MMHLSILLALAGLVIAAPQAEEAAPDVSELVKATGGQNATSLTPDQFHDLTVSSMGSEYIVNSDKLYDYLSNNHGTNHTIYVNDTRSFIKMSEVKQQVDKRQYSQAPCFGYTNHWAEQVQRWWSEWNPASSCLYTGNSQSGGSYNIGWSYSRSISTNSGVSWNIIKDVFSVSSGVDVSQTWSNSGSVTCNVPSGSVGQIWVQNYLVWGWMWSAGCESCSYGGSGCGGRFGYNPRADGGALAPASSKGWQGYNYGCSTGWDKVRC